MKLEGEMLEIALECAEGIYIIEEESKKIVYVNSFMRTKAEEEAEGKYCYQYFCGRSEICPYCPQFDKRVHEVYQWEYFDHRSRRWVNIKNKLMNKDGIWYRVGNVNLIQEIMDLTKCSVGEIHTLKELLQSHEQRKYLLEWEAYHDRMTRLFNRSRFMKDNVELFPKYRQAGVLYLDINNLKETNDTKGHAAGDELIKKTAGILEEKISESIKAYRIGGDEFLVVMLGAGEDKIRWLQDMFHRELEAANQRDGHYCSVASGCAWGNSEHGIEKILREADQRMYQNKETQK